MAVRNESVRLSLDDDFTSGMARAAAATALLNRQLNDLSGNAVRSHTGLSTASRDIDNLGGSARRNGAEIDKLSGRLRLFADLTAILGPGLVPIAAVGVPAVTGLATALAAVGTAGAGALVAFQGVGDAVKAVEEARLDPTVANLQKAQEAMGKLGPDAQEFVRAFQEFRPVLRDIRDSAAEGLFPGLTESLDSFEELAPKIARILREVNEASGEALANGVESLTTERWRPFFNFLAREMPAAVTSLSRIVGDLAHGAAEMWMAFDPGNDAFLGWLEDVASSFDDWASSAEATEGIEEFLAYVQETGPMVADLFGSLVNLLVQIAQAAAPIGGPILKGLTAVADALAAIAGSDAGTEILVAVAAMSALSRASAGFAAVTRTTWAQNISGANGFVNVLGSARQAAIRGAAGIGLLATSMTDLDEKAGLANTTTGGLIGTMLKGGRGGAIGLAIGATLDLAAANESLAQSTERANAAAESGDLALMQAEYATHIQRLQELNDARDDFWNFAPAEGDSWLDKVKNDMAVIGDLFTDDGDKAQAAAVKIRESIAYVESGLLGVRRAGDGLGSLLSGPLGEIDRSFENATMSASEFAAELLDLNEVLSGRSAMRDYQAAIDEVSASIKENGRTLDITTAKGRANQAVLDNIAASALKIAEGIKSADVRADFLKNARSAFVQAAEDLGQTRKRARELADEFGLLGKTKVKPPRLDLDDRPAKDKLTKAERAMEAFSNGNYEAALRIDDGQARGAITGVENALNSIPDETVVINVRTEGQGFRPPSSALGNIFTYASGGMDRPNSHWPEFAGPGPTRMWREPETQGESYIPHANDHRRPRAKSILEQTAGMFGGQVQWFANGGMSSASLGIGTAASLFSGALMGDLRAELQELLEDYRERRREFLKSERPDTAEDLRAELDELHKDYVERRKAFLREESRRSESDDKRERRSVELALELAQMLQGIRDLRKQLAADGKDRLRGIDRRVAELQLEVAQKELRLARKREEREARQEAAEKAREKLRQTRSDLLGIGQGFSLDDLAPDNRPTTVAQGALAEVAQLRRDILAAGGLWTKGLTRWAKELVAAASALDDVNAQLVAENAKRDQLVASIADQQQALDQLNSTMTSFAASVANNFLTNPFNQTLQGGAPSAALADARAQLAAIRGSATGDSSTAAALASQLIAQIKKLEAGEGSVSGLAAFDQTLGTDISNIAAMNAALDQLASKGLDVSGALGGLYEQLALTGDLQTAQQLAELSAAEIDQREKLFALRQDQAAAIGAKVTQNIYGQQQAQMQTALAASQATLVKIDAGIAKLEALQTALGVDVRGMAPGVAAALKPQVDNLRHDVQHTGPRNTAEHLRRMALGN